MLISETKQKLEKLQAALSAVEDKIVLRSDKVLEEREYAISEIRYYKKILVNFFEYSKIDQTHLAVSVQDSLEEIRKWLQP